MTIPIYQVDAFTDQLFGGNYAAVCPLDKWPEDALLQKIAEENNVAETAFFIQDGSKFHIRWFTPEIEMDLCGHATLATAHVIFNHLEYAQNNITFTSASGELIVRKKEDCIELDFPVRKPLPTQLPEIIQRGIGQMPMEVLKARDYILVLDSEQTVRNLKPNLELLNQINIDPGGIIVTAKGDRVDFVSRFFTPQAAIFEDPVTGSAHCSLIPYWAEKLGKTKLTALQVSKRLGMLTCELANDRVYIGGKSITYLEGKINVKI